MNNAQVIHLGNHAINICSHVHWNLGDERGLQVWTVMFLHFTKRIHPASSLLWAYSKPCLPGHPDFLRLIKAANVLSHLWLRNWWASTAGAVRSKLSRTRLSGSCHSATKSIWTTQQTRVSNREMLRMTHWNYLLQYYL